MTTASPIGVYSAFDDAPAFIVDGPRSITIEYQPETATPRAGLVRTAAGSLAALLAATGGFGGLTFLHRIDLNNVATTFPYRIATPSELLALAADAPLSDSVARLLTMKNGWADGEGIAPQLPAVAWARDFGEKLGHRYAANVIVAPTRDGGVVLERQIGSSRWSLDVDPDGAPFLVVVSDSGTDTSEPADPAAAANSFREFLVRPVAVRA